MVFTNNTANIRCTRNFTLIKYFSLQCSCLSILTNNTTNKSCTISSYLYTTLVSCTVNSATILSYNTAKIHWIIVYITVISIRCLYMKGNTGNSILNNATFLVNTSYTANIFLTGNTATVGKFIISSRYRTAVAACNAADVLFA